MSDDVIALALFFELQELAKKVEVGRNGWSLVFDVPETIYTPCLGTHCRWYGTSGSQVRIGKFRVVCACVTSFNLLISIVEAQTQVEHNVSNGDGGRARNTGQTMNQNTTIRLLDLV